MAERCLGCDAELEHSEHLLTHLVVEGCPGIPDGGGTKLVQLPALSTLELAHLGLAVEGRLNWLTELQVIVTDVSESPTLPVMVRSHLMVLNSLRTAVMEAIYVGQQISRAMVDQDDE